MPLEPVGGGPVVPVIFWPGSGSSPVGQTPFGIYDSDAEFVSTAPNVAKWVASTMGYPIVSIELQDTNIYTNLEMATMKFISIVNEFNMRENMLAYQGLPTGSSFSQTLIKSTPIPYIVQLAGDYGSDSKAGGTVELKRGYVTMLAGQSRYNLQNLWAAASESGNRLEIQTVFHERVPALQRFFDPFAGTGTDMSSLLGSFGWTGFAVASNFLIMPIFETLLRAQAIELNDQIRRSNFSFKVQNNTVHIFPVPEFDDHGSKIWFEYTLEKDKFLLFDDPSGSLGRLKSGVVSDFSNAPFSFVPFGDINDVGREWIYRYTLALCKITLGNIRSKYESLPIPNSEVRLDGGALRQEGQTEIDKLEQFLRESLLETGKEAQMEKQSQNEENMQHILQRIPVPIYIF